MFGMSLVGGPKPSIEKFVTSQPARLPSDITQVTPPPEELSTPGRRNWEILLADLQQLGVYRDADSLILVELCEMLARAQEIRRSMANPPRGWWNTERDFSDDIKVELDEFARESAEGTLSQADREHMRSLWGMSQSCKRLRTEYLQTMKAVKTFIDEFGATPVARLRLGLLKLQGASIAEALGAGDDDAPPADGHEAGPGTTINGEVVP